MKKDKTEKADQDLLIGKTPSTRETLATSVVLGLMLLVVLVGLPPRWGAFGDITTRILVFFAWSLLISQYTYRRYYKPLIDSKRKTKVWDLPDYQVSVLQRSAGRSGSFLDWEMEGAAQAKAFALHVLFPSTVRQRITERYEPSQRTLVQRVTIDVQLPERTVRELMTSKPSHSENLERKSDSDADTGHRGAHAGEPVVLFPVLVPRKGEMVDNLRVLGSDESTLPVLSYRQYLQLVARVTRTLLTISYSSDIKPTTHPEAFNAEHLALRGVMKRADGNIDDSSGSNALLQLRKPSTLSTDPRPTNQATLQLAAQLASKLTSHYAIVAAIRCPKDGRFVVSYERMITPTLELASRSGWLNWIKARLRLMFGARPVDISVGLDNACTSQSYHLIVDGQDGVYVAGQESPKLINYFDGHWSRIRRRQADGKDVPPPPYYRFRRRAGQRYAHFYTRFFPEPVDGLPDGDKLPAVRFRFYEVPPGSVFRAVVTSTAAAALIWLIGFVASRRPDPGTDVPAFLLVFPAVAAAWLGFDGQGRRLLEGTLASRLSLLGTVVSSIAASGLFMIYKAKLPYFHWENPMGLRVLGIYSLAWSVLVLGGILNASTITYMYLARTWQFIHLSGREDAFTEAHEHG